MEITYTQFIRPFPVYRIPKNPDRLSTVNLFGVFFSFTGLIGPLIVCKKGTLNENWPWERKDINHEFVLRFALTNEGLSWYFNENKNLAGNASAVNESKSWSLSKDKEGPKFRTIMLFYVFCS